MTYFQGRSTAARGLGDAGAGIPLYTGSNPWYQAPDPSWPTGVIGGQAVNGSVNNAMIDFFNNPTSAVAAYHGNDAWLQPVAKVWLANHIGGPGDAHTDFLWTGALTPADWQAITGVDPTSQPWYRRKVGGDVLGALFVPGYGSFGRVADAPGNAGMIITFPQVDPQKDPLVLTVPWQSPDLQSIHDTMTAQYRAWAAGPYGGLANQLVAPTDVIVRTKEQEGDAGPVGPPSGWHHGTLDGVDGWWAPDGLFYSGKTPWIDYIAGTGKHLQPVVRPDEPAGVVDSGGTGIPLPPAPLMPPDSGLVFTHDVPPEGAVNVDGGPVTEGPGFVGVASPGGMNTALLVGGAVLGAFLLFGRKRA